MFPLWQTMTGNFVVDARMHAKPEVPTMLSNSVPDPARRPALAGAICLGASLFVLPAEAQELFATPGTPVDEAASTGDTRTLALGDMDGDGDLDLAVGAWSSSFRIWINDGSGSFTDSGFDESVNGHNVNDLVLADFDQDGDLDVVSVRDGGEDTRVWMNDGSGGLSDDGQSLPNGNDADTGDLDGDGYPDLVLDSGIVYINDGSGQFNELTDLPFKGEVAIGDMNGDGDQDILLAGPTSGRVYISDGQDPPGFASSGSQPTDGLRSADLVDVDSDSDLDAVTSTGVYENDGNGNFSTKQDWVPEEITTTTVGDVDQDGAADAILGLREGVFTGAPDEVWLNNGSGLFSDAGLALGDARTGALVLGDIDGDGDLDLVAGNPGGEPVYIYRNQRNLIFQDRFEP